MKKVILENAAIEIHKYTITVTTEHCTYSTARDKFDLLDNELFTLDFTMALSDADFKALKAEF